MLFLSSILNRIEDNCVYDVSKLLKEVEVSNTGIKRIKEHPDYPSMLSLSDTLKNWKIESAGIKVDTDKILVLPLPFIAQIKAETEGELFTIVKTINQNTVTISKPATARWITIPKEQFQHQATGMILVIV